MHFIQTDVSTNYVDILEKIEDEPFQKILDGLRSHNAEYGTFPAKLQAPEMLDAALPLAFDEAPLLQLQTRFTELLEKMRNPSLRFTHIERKEQQQKFSHSNFKKYGSEDTPVDQRAESSHGSFAKPNYRNTPKVKKSQVDNARGTRNDEVSSFQHMHESSDDIQYRLVFDSKTRFSNRQGETF